MDGSRLKRVTSQLAIAVAGGLVAVTLMGGGPAGAFNVPINSVTSAKIVDNTIQGIDIKNGTVAAVDIATAGVGSAEVSDDSLAGADVNESALGVVPSAASAQNADSLDGIDSSDLIQVGGVRTEANVSLPDCAPGVDYLTRSFVAPRAGHVLVSASFTGAEDIAISGGYLAARIERASPFATGVWQEEYISDAGRGNVSLTEVFSVAQGSNTFVLKVCDEEDGPNRYATAGQMTLLYTPFGL